MVKKYLNGIVSAILVFAMAGCATDKQRTQTQGTVLGATGGAILGGLGGFAVAALKGDSKHAGEYIVAGATAGAIAGGAMGYRWGTTVARKKAEYANSEDYLDACIGDARSLRTQAEKENQRLAGEVDNLDKQSRDLKVQLSQGKVTQQELATKKQAVDSRRAVVQKEIQRISEEIKIQREAIAQGAGAKKVGDLHGEVVALQQQKSQLEQYNQKLSQISNRCAT